MTVAMRPTHPAAHSISAPGLKGDLRLPSSVLPKRNVMPTSHRQNSAGMKRPTRRPIKLVSVAIAANEFSAALEGLDDICKIQALLGGALAECLQVFGILCKRDSDRFVYHV